MKRLILSLFCLCTLSLFAQDYHELIRYAAQDGNADGVIYYATQILNENPKDVDALYWKSLAQVHIEQYQEAYQSATLAIKAWKKNDPIYTLGDLYANRALIYEYMGNNRNAYDDYNTAIKKGKKQANLYNARAEFYIRMDMLDLATLDYVKAFELSHTPDYAVEIARCGAKLDKLADSKGLLEVILSEYPTHAESIRLLAVINQQLGNNRDCIDQYSHYIEINGGGSFETFLNAADEEYGYAVQKLTDYINKNDSLQDFWLALRICTYELKEQYTQALNDIAQLQTLVDTLNGFVENEKRNCYYGLKQYDNALQAAINIKKLHEASNEVDESDYFTIANIYCNLNNYEEAIVYINSAIQLRPSLGFLYYYKSHYQQQLGDLDAALTTLNDGLLVEDTNLLLHLVRGKLLLRKGNTAKANKDFEYVLANDTLDSNTIAAYALHYLGRDQEAIESLNKVLEANPDDEDTFYNAACIYSLINNSEKAIEYLRRTLELGYDDFEHIEEDSDLDNIRQLDSFIDLIKEFHDK